MTKPLLKNLQYLLLAVGGSAIVVCTWGLWSVFGRPRPVDTDFTSYLLSLPDHTKITTTIAGRRYLLEVVNTASSITQGLSDRQEIGADGMLFVLPTKAYQSFWMPRMNFDLDLLWLDDATIVEITPNVPKPSPGTQTWQLPQYPSHQPVNLVLELPAGRAALMDIKVGHQLQIAR